MELEAEHGRPAVRRCDAVPRHCLHPTGEGYLPLFQLLNAMGRLHPLRSFVAVLAIAVAVASAVCSLPENAYQRWQLLDGTIHGRSRWIYERIHFDPRPIDVAIVG